MEFQRVSILGAEVNGIDLTADLDESEIEQIKDGLARHQVLFFRDQPLSGDQLRAVARRFGDLFIQPFFAHKYGELLFLENDENRPPKLNTFHQDLTGLERPPGEHFLHALIVPDGGGDTIWSSLYAAYETLSETMQRFLSGLTVTHDCMKNYRPVLTRQGLAPEKIEAFAQRMPPQHHPLVRTHPVTGRKGIFVNPLFTVKIDGLEPFENELLLNFLYQHIAKPEFCVRLKWEVHTLAVWDNRCTSHYAVADYFPQRRRMQRATTEGDKPF